MNASIQLTLCLILMNFATVSARATGLNWMSVCNLSDVCSEHGVCEASESGPKCLCHEGYRGKRCEHCKRN
uniref:EGF-like domain-containing protein n=1 Tax=Plectus sambesii TaxID=2011161 RepID=A0A914UWU7_9BILA